MVKLEPKCFPKAVMLYVELLGIVRETKCGHILLMHTLCCKQYASSPSDKQIFYKTINLKWIHKYASDLFEPVSLETDLMNTKHVYIFDHLLHIKSLRHY